MNFKSILILVLTGLLISCGSSDQGQEIVVTENEQVQGRGEGKDNWWDNLPRDHWGKFERVELPEDQGWFEVYKITDRIYALYEMGQFEEVISYLILGSERALLFDTGIGVGDIRSLVTALTDLPVSVLNSHTHYDHVGGNYLFNRIYGTGTDYTKNHENGRPNEEVREFVGPGWVWKDMPNEVTVDNYTSKPFKVTDIVNDGFVIDLGDKTLEVFLVPGHTPDALVLLDRRDRLLFMGDTFYPASLYAHMGDANFGDYVASAKRLSEMAQDVDILLPAHNEPWVPSEYLNAMYQGFLDIQKPGAEYRITDGDREYRFDGFTIMVSDPAPWEIEEEE
ncbi:MBL fold metallo-hydrolase [Pseudemcibacter aquimaris]|uniref:MBL fold metallo-hydrolase n=1 Tax=Pseudemcibacter aquimaris TaxID=2857064 RepID=UPI002011A6E0|nr:MBL fold metallo-hydrolase [Pseudemcibacter aquimaris]MCC3860847.1 MBL fold metallo-hydrolase [Pseudemcibacter aquimaris]WDU59666.1 MBL fold metallo-hydrolase [Pseudemcibacter aquimaris]